MNEYRFADISLGLVHSFQVTVANEVMDAFRPVSGHCTPLNTNPSTGANIPIAKGIQS